MVETVPHTIVFDFGAGTMRRLLEAGKKIADVTHIFLSHFHPDHSSEIIPFLFATKYYEQIKRPEGVKMIAGNGFNKFYKGLIDVYGDWLEPCDGFLDRIELDSAVNKKVDIDAFSVHFEKVKHKPESLAYRITFSNNKSVVYSGDTGFNDNLILLSDQADLLICESAFPDGEIPERHLTPSLAGTIAERANVKKLVLTHFYPECDKVDVAKQCRSTYDGPLILAEDLMEIKI